MFGFIKKVFVVTMTFFDCNVLNVNSLKCVSMNNQGYKIKTWKNNINSNEPLFYPYSINVNVVAGTRTSQEPVKQDT